MSFDQTLNLTVENVFYFIFIKTCVSISMRTSDIFPTPVFPFSICSYCSYMGREGGGGKGKGAD